MPKWENFYKEEIDGEVHALVAPPVNDGNRFNVNRDLAWLAAHGFTEWTDEGIEEWHEAHPAPAAAPIDDTAFRSACKTFREVCAQIGTAIGVSSFRGGFDEMAAFRASPASSTVEGLALAVAWSAANEYAKYEGQKIGYGQPQWWYKCWEFAE